MISYEDTMKTLGARGIEFSPSEFPFALMVAMGIGRYEAYSTTVGIVSKSDDSEKRKLCDILLAQPRMNALVEYLKDKYNIKVSEDSLHIEDINLTQKQLKNIYGKLILDAYEHPENASYSDLAKIMGSFVKNFPAPDDDADFGRHFIQVMQPYNAVCAQCNHEFDLAPNITSICPHCGHKYVWDEESGKFLY